MRELLVPAYKKDKDEKDPDKSRADSKSVSSPSSKSGEGSAAEAPGSNSLSDLSDGDASASSLSNRSRRAAPVNLSRLVVQTIETILKSDNYLAKLAEGLESVGLFGAPTQSISEPERSLQAFRSINAKSGYKKEASSKGTIGGPRGDGDDGAGERAGKSIEDEQLEARLARQADSE